MIGGASTLLNELPEMGELPLPRGPSPDQGPGAPADAQASFDLLIRARSGDNTARDELFARYLPRIQRWAHGRLPRAARGAQDSCDLAQDALAKVFQRLQEFEPRHPGAFKAYVWTTLWNCVRDTARKYQRAGPHDQLDDEIPGCLPSPLEEAIGLETLERYEQALDRLRPEDKEAIVARVEMGLPYGDVAAALSKPTIAAAQMAVSRALVKLAAEMAHDRKR